MLLMMLLKNTKMFQIAEQILQTLQRNFCNSSLLTFSPYIYQIQKKTKNIYLR
jgi:hypothetical protein